MSISTDIKKYISSQPLRLHTPGHKGELMSDDITELADESFPGDCIKKAESDIAKLYGAKNAHILCCGSSQGVKAAIYRAGKNGIADVNSHRSVFDGFKLAGKTVVTAGESGSVRPVTVSDIDGGLQKDTGVVVVTSPTYYGFVADIDGISDLCRRKGLIFIIDGAHGAHFGFSPLLPPGFAKKCDMCNVSAHKTLFALNQGAVLLDNIGGLDDPVKMMGTTSPSYPVMASVEDGVKRAAESGERYTALFEPIKELKSGLPFIDNDDFTRPVLDCGALGVSAKKLNAALATKNVYAELVTDRYIVFLFTAADGAIQVRQLDEAIRSSLREMR